MKIKKILAAFLVLLTLSGCSGISTFSNFKEVENLEIISTLGIDMGEDLLVTAGTGIGLDGSEPRIYEKNSESLAAAVYDLQKLHMGKEAFFSHTEHVVLGEEAARQGVYEHLDFVERSTDMRIDVLLLIVKGNTASELIKGASGAKASASDVFSHLEENIQNAGAAAAFTCEDIAASLLEKGAALVLAVEAVPIEELFSGQGKMEVVPVGFAVLVEGKLQRYLDGEESAGSVILMSALKEGELEVDLGDEKHVTVSVDGLGTEYSPEFSENGDIEKVKITAKLSATVLSTSEDVKLSDDNFRLAIERQIEEKEKSRVEAAIKAVQEIGYDYLRLGDSLNLKAPVKFAKMPTDWETLLKTCKFDVEVKCELARTYDIEDSLSDSDKEEGNFWNRIL